MAEKAPDEPKILGKLKTYRKRASGIFVPYKTADIELGEVVIFKSGFEPEHVGTVKEGASLVRQARGQQRNLECWAYFSNKHKGIFLSPNEGDSKTVLYDPFYNVQSDYIYSPVRAGEVVLMGFVGADPKDIDDQIQRWEEKLPKDRQEQKAPSTGYRIL